MTPYNRLVGSVIVSQQRQRRGKCSGIANKYVQVSHVCRASILPAGHGLKFRKMVGSDARVPAALLSAYPALTDAPRVHALAVHGDSWRRESCTVTEGFALMAW